MLNHITENREIIYIGRRNSEDVKLRVSAYVRVSSNSEDQLNSFETQLTHYQKLISKNNEWQMIDIYCDEGISGQSTAKREDFNRMMDDAKRGKLDRIITKSISRFARNTQDTISSVRELKEHGVSVLFEKENIDTAQLQGEMLLSVFSSLAQEELISISKNMKQSNRIRIKQGTYISSSVPYGYRLKNKQMVIHEEEAEIVKRIFADYLSGKGVYTIAKELTEDGVLTATGNDKWRESTVTALIKNERLKGDMLLQKSYSPDVFPLKSVKNKGEMARYYVKNSHERIIPVETFDRVVELLERKNIQRNAHSEYPLSRKIRCDDCGATFKRSMIRKKVYWMCHNRYEDKNNCSVTQIPEDEVYQAFIRMYHKLKENYEYILIPMLKSLVKLSDSNYRGNKNMEQLNKEIATLSEQSHTLNGFINQGVLDSALFISQKDNLNQKVRKLKSEKRMLLQDEKDQSIEQTEELIAILEDGTEYLTTFNTELMEDIVTKVIAYEDRTIGFILINGLEIKETIKQARR